MGQSTGLQEPKMANWKLLSEGLGVRLLSSDDWTQGETVFAARSAGLTAYEDTAEAACEKLTRMFRARTSAKERKNR